MAVRTVRKAVEEDTYEESSEYQEETPAPRASKRSTGPVGSGWGAPKAERREVKKAPYLDIKKAGKFLLKIHDAEPPVRFRQHYVNSTGKYFTCSEERDGREIVTRCPLCDAGHYASQQYRMNVTDLKDPNEVKTWTFGQMVANILIGLSDTVALNDPNRYFQMWRTKPTNGGTWTYTILPLKARDLEEDYGVVPFDEDALAELEEQLYGEETLWISSESDLEKAARNLTDADTKRN